MAPKVHIGTSGFSYSNWRGSFYPENLATRRWMEYYSTQFNTVELNNTFYRFPVAKNLATTADATPDGYKITVKMHRLITHNMRMKNTRLKIDEFMHIIDEGIGGKLACVLFQLPPSYSFSEERLNDILSNVPQGNYNVIEFRHRTWWNETVYKALKENSLSFCSVSYPGLPEDNIATSNVFYKRMHGVPNLFESPYTTKQLEDLAESIPSVKEAYIYFNNTSFGSAYQNGRELQLILDQTPPSK